MRGRMRTISLGAGVLLALLPALGWAQYDNPENENIDATSRQATIGKWDQDVISRWIENEVDLHKTDSQDSSDGLFGRFRERMMTRFKDSSNTPAFVAQFAVQTAKIAENRFSESATDVKLARSLARVLVDMGRSETLPGLLAGLRLNDHATRYLSVKGIIAQRDAYAADRNDLTPVMEALAEVGKKETSPVVLAHIYVALSLPNHLNLVFGPLMEILDQRLTNRRRAEVRADGAEIDAYEFFRTPAVRDALGNEQKQELVRRLAVLLRLDAERYNVANLPFEEQTKIEHTLWAGEELLAALVGNSEDGIRKQLEAAGYEGRTKILPRVEAWIGHAESNQNGILNAAPWNVPPGAP